MLFVLLFIVFVDVLSSKEERLIVELVADIGGQNELHWKLEREVINGSFEVIDDGSGINNALTTFTNLRVDDTDCIRYHLTDDYGDGIDQRTPSSLNGHIDIYFGNASIDNMIPTETLRGKAYSDEYLTSGRGGYKGDVFYYLTSGCVDSNGGCNQDIAIDVIFVLDTSSDLLFECQNYYFSAIIDLIENHLPKYSLKISIVTFGTDDSILLSSNTYSSIIKAPFGSDDLIDITFGSDGSWANYSKYINGFADSQCIGGGHSTIDAIDYALNIYTETYGDIYDTTRQQYIVLFTNDIIDNEQTQYYSCSNLKQSLAANQIQFILLSQVTPNQYLECLATANDYVITTQYLSKIMYKYDNIQELMCSADINVAITEIFIDDNNNGYWIEIVNLGVGFDVSSLQFNGNLLSGKVLLGNDSLIDQGDIFIIGNMGDPSSTPCDIYSTESNLDCNHYFHINYTGNAQLNDFILSINCCDNASISMNTADNFEIESGFSYELQYLYNDFTNISYWRESCYRYGSPGSINEAYCAPVPCSPLTCRSNGDNTAYCLGQCVCSSTYYYDADNTRSCIEVERPGGCTAFVIGNGDIEVTWTPSDNGYQLDSYTIKYGSSEVTDQGYMISYFFF